MTFLTINYILLLILGSVLIVAIEDSFNSKVNGKVLTFSYVDEFFIDKQTKSKWDNTGTCVDGKLKGKQLKIEIHSNHFAFAWFEFHPNSIIYKD